MQNVHANKQSMIMYTLQSVKEYAHLNAMRMHTVCADKVEITRKAVAVLACTC